MKRISPLTIVDRALAVVCVLLALGACGAGEADIEGLMADMLASSETESGRDVTFGPLALRLPARWELHSAGGSARVDSEIGELVFKSTGSDEPGVSGQIKLPGEAVNRLRLDLAAQCSHPSKVYVDDMTATRPLRLLVGVCENDDVANPRDETYWVRYVVLAHAGGLTVDLKGQGSLVEARTRMDPILVDAWAH